METTADKIRRIVEDTESDREAESTQVLESEYFGVWKGTDSRQISERYLDLRFRDGQRTTFDYPDRKLVNYNPELPCIDINFDGNLVTIIGRDIEKLYELFTARKIEWIKEADDPEHDDPEKPVFVEEILISPPGAPQSDEKTKTE